MTLRRVIAGGALAALVWGATVDAARGSQTALEAPRSLESRYRNQIQPLLKDYCFSCHSTAKHKGDIDLERFTNALEALKHPLVWPQVIEQLSLSEMPPKEKRQPTPIEREKMLAWVNRALEIAANARAGDPGPVVLRRLDNAEYTYTVRDLTGVASLDPAREFPADGAAGEGFMNTGNALAMSPALLGKYLDAAKEIASHAVLLPDGFRFSAGVSRRDWTEELLVEIRGLYSQYADAGGAHQVNLQGIVFDTNQGGRLPVERYLQAALELRARGFKRRALAPGEPWPQALTATAAARGLSPKYLASLWNELNQAGPSPALAGLRKRWLTATPADAAALAGEIGRWQRALWKFSSVGQLGKAGGPKAWMEPVNPLVAQQDVRLKLSAPTNGGPVTVCLIATDAGDGNAADFVEWRQPRLVAPGRPDLLLRDARDYIARTGARRVRILAATAQALAAAAEAESAPPGTLIDLNSTARRHQVDPEVLAVWFDYLGVGAPADVNLFTNHLTLVGGHEFASGWGSPDTPSLVANASGEAVRIPGALKPHGVVMHPSPTLNVAVGWRSPLSGAVRIEAAITHAHPECGNGIEWFVELRRGRTRQRLGHGYAQGSKTVAVGPFDNVGVQRGDLVSVLIGPRDGNHSCDLTDVDFTVKSTGPTRGDWSLAADVSSDVLAANPHADAEGRPGIWSFYSEPIAGGETGPALPAGSLLARWQSAGAADKNRLADELQQLLATGLPDRNAGPDAALHRQLASLGGPLLAGARRAAAGDAPSATGSAEWALDPALFGRRPGGGAVDPASLCVQAPCLLEIPLPADLADGCELVTTAVLNRDGGAEGSVQAWAAAQRPAGLTPDATGLAPDRPVLVCDGSAARSRMEQSFDEFRRWFPAALCYSKIVPVDEVITLTLFHREDEPLCRLMLDERQKACLDRLWTELRFVSRDALTLVDAFEQLWQYATQDADPKVFEPLRQPILDRAAQFRHELVAAEPAQLDSLARFASRAYRRTLTDDEAKALRALYDRLRADKLSHEDAFRLTLARLFVSPAFLYRLENAPDGPEPGLASDWELANRLSYFLWSSAPDDELRAAAESGRLRDPAALVAQARRLLRDGRVRRLAAEFGCAWLQVRDFETLDEKSERHFPTFAGLRSPMYEEVVRFFADAFQNNAPLDSLFDGDHTFLNEPLARHYGIPGVKGEEWRKVGAVRQYGRGGVLGFGATLAKESGASRTSPILRGNWVSEVLLGDKLPRPPKDVPRLPEDEGSENLTVRQLVAKHSADPRCYGCHRRIDGYGFALEGYDAIGRARSADLGGRPIDLRSKAPDGTELDGAAGLRRYLLTVKREAVTRQFCRKLLGYALGRSVILSDHPLIAEMQRQMRSHDNRIDAAVEAIVRSRQFREIRGREMADAD